MRIRAFEKQRSVIVVLAVGPWYPCARNRRKTAQGLFMNEPLPTNSPPALNAAENLRDIAEILPWVARGKKTFRAFWKTVLLVIAHPGDLGLLLNQPLSGDDARRFRRRAILYHMVAFGMILLGGLILITSFSSSGDGAPVLPLLLIISFVVEGGWLAVYTVTSITRGFLRTPNMTRAGRRNAALLADYLVSPLAMFVLGVVTVPTLAPELGRITFGQGWLRPVWFSGAAGGCLVVLLDCDRRRRQIDHRPKRPTTCPVRNGNGPVVVDCRGCDRVPHVYRGHRNCAGLIL